MNSRSRIDCFGLQIAGLSTDEILRAIQANDSKRPFWIVTANPEILLCAKRDPSYADTLRKAGLRIADGAGLRILGLLRGKRIIRTAGADLAEALVAWAHETGQSAGFIGGVPGTAARACAKMAQKYPGLKCFAEQGGIVSLEGKGDDANEEARHRLTLQAPDILLAAFGHPKQERWIERYVSDFPSLKAVMGVGGTFDYWAGTVRRAPKWMREIGLEWLYRLIKEPKRWRRIWDAVVVFPWYVLKELTHSSKIRKIF
jgi:N-acetylglucosaminyldiphosphoundecaprenol N-acetyl-beta-D-mannosaminyltransferase